MATNKKFDAVAQSRKWRIATSKKLSAMGEKERLAHLNQGIAGKLESLVGKEPQKRTQRPRSQKRSTVAH